jgi:C4-dicarboxylate-specific signal transduction histidine kinase
MVEMAQVAGQYWYFILLPLIAALVIAAASLYMLRKGRRAAPEEEEVERVKERLSAMVRERTAFLERANAELARSEEK